MGLFVADFWVISGAMATTGFPMFISGLFGLRRSAWGLIFQSYLFFWTMVAFGQLATLFDHSTYSRPDSLSLVSLGLLFVIWVSTEWVFVRVRYIEAKKRGVNKNAG